MSLSRDDDPSLVMSVPQVAQFFRNGVGGCQYEGGRLRWWSDDHLTRLELNCDAAGIREWRLFLVPDRRPDLPTSNPVSRHIAVGDAYVPEVDA